MLRYVLLAILILTAALTPKMHVSAQDDGNWLDGCDGRTIALIADYITDINYTGMCEVFRECALGVYGDVAHCGAYAADALLRVCSTEACDRYGLLLSAIISFFGDSEAEEEEHQAPPQIVMSHVPQMLRAYQDGAYTEVLNHLETIEHESGLDSKLIARVMMSQGLMYETLDEPGNALAAYDRAMNLAPFDPLIGYTRAMLLGTMGQGDRVAFEVEWLIRSMRLGNWYPYPETLLEDLQVLQEQYPFPYDLAETWLAYPLSGAVWSGVALLEIDDDPITVELIPYAPTGGMVIMGLEGHAMSWDRYAEVEAFFLPYDEVSQSYNNLYPVAYRFDNPIYLGKLAANERVFLLKIYEIESHGLLIDTFLLTRPGEPDPRLDVPGLRCGAISTLHPGAKVRSMNFEGRTPIFDAPNGTELGISSRFTILQEHQCIDGTALWWEARSEDGIVGWIQENDRIEYLLNAASDPYGEDLLVYCPGILTPRISMGMSARVVKGDGANNIRSAPSQTADVVGQIPEGDTLTVTNGAVCADGHLWWPVDYNGVKGWTAEGLGNEYWLEPIYDDEVATD